MYVIIGVIVAIVLAIVGMGLFNEERNTLGVIAIILAIVAFAGGIYCHLNFTESGKRSLKSMTSDYTGGIERTITVYAYDGEILYQYSGKFDYSSDGDRIIFDDENGNRHSIFNTIGTVIIEENETDKTS